MLSPVGSREVMLNYYGVFFKLVGVCRKLDKQEELMFRVLDILEPKGGRIPDFALRIRSLDLDGLCSK
jgi:hypothetical protein